MTRRLFLLLFAVLALAVGVAACGGDDDDDASDAPTAEDTATDEGGGEAASTSCSPPTPTASLAFDQTELTAAAGEVTIEFTNESGIPHNVEVEGNGVEEVSDTITEGIDRADRDARARRVHVLLRRPRPSRGRHGGHAHGRSSSGCSSSTSSTSAASA